MSHLLARLASALGLWPKSWSIGEVDLEIQAWTVERYDAILRGDERKVDRCEAKIEALAFLRERIAA